MDIKNHLILNLGCITVSQHCDHIVNVKLTVTIILCYDSHKPIVLPTKVVPGLFLQSRLHPIFKTPLLALGKDKREKDPRSVFSKIRLTTRTLFL